MDKRQIAEADCTIEELCYVDIFQVTIPSGVVHKLRLQEEVGKYVVKNCYFRKVECINEGG